MNKYVTINIKIKVKTDPEDEDTMKEDIYDALVDAMDEDYLEFEVEHDEDDEDDGDQ
jgi:hypothetical protein